MTFGNMRAHETNTRLMGVLLFWLVAVGVAIWVYSVGGINVAWYSLRYKVSTDKVHVDAKPRDCDFMVLDVSGFADDVTVRFNDRRKGHVFILE